MYRVFVLIEGVSSLGRPRGKGPTTYPKVSPVHLDVGNNKEENSGDNADIKRHMRYNGQHCFKDVRSLDSKNLQGAAPRRPGYLEISNAET